jgi:hypothetical protein
VRYGIDERQAARADDDPPQEQARRCVRQLEAMIAARAHQRGSGEARMGHLDLFAGEPRERGLLNEQIVEDGATVFAHACRLGAEGILSKKVDQYFIPRTEASLCLRLR